MAFSLLDRQTAAIIEDSGQLWTANGVLVLSCFMPEGVASEVQLTNFDRFMQSV